MKKSRGNLPIYILVLILFGMTMFRAMPEFDRVVRRPCDPIEFSKNQNEVLNNGPDDFQTYRRSFECSKPTDRSRYYDFVNLAAAAGLSVMLAMKYLDSQSETKN